MFPALVYAVLATAVVSSLGMLLVPVVVREMAVPANTAQWIITGNLLVGAVAAPTVGRIADGPRKRRLLILILFVAFVGSAIAALAQNFAMLLIGRIIQGVVYGIVPVAIALARVHLARTSRPVAIATLSITVSVGIGIGYPVTGLTVTWFGMPAAFWTAAGFIASAVAVVWWQIPSREPPVVRVSFDFAGAALLSATLACLVVLISEAPTLGWSSPLVWVLAGSVAALGLNWVWTSRFARLPFVDVGSLRLPMLLTTHAVGFALAATIYLAMSTASIVAQAPEATGYGFGMPALWAGFVIMPLSIGSFVANRCIAWLLHKMHLYDLLMLGSAVIATGQLALLLFHGVLWQLFTGMFVVGVGMGIVFGASPLIVARSVRRSEAGSAMSFNQVLRTIGGTVGSAGAGSIFAGFVALQGLPSMRGIELTHLLAAVIAVGAVLALLIGRRHLKGKTT